MKKYLREIIILALQLFMFYIFPLFAGPTDAMGMVLLIIMATAVLSAVLGGISGTHVKFFYPAITAVLFIPSVWIYYNSSALMHAVWYLVISATGLFVGTLVRFVVMRICKKRK